MWIIDRVKDKDKESITRPNGYNQARCYKCGYAFNIDLFTQKDVAMIMEAHRCNE